MIPTGFLKRKPASLGTFGQELTIDFVEAQIYLKEVEKLWLDISTNWNKVVLDSQKRHLEEKNWNSRYDGIKFLIDFNNQLSHFYNISENSYFIIAKLGQPPIGFMQIDNENNICVINMLATHPGIRGLGIMLIEYAVLTATQIIKSKRIELYTLYKSINFYKSMGFQTLQNNEMFLDFTTSPMWRPEPPSYKYVGLQ